VLPPLLGLSTLGVPAFVLAFTVFIPGFTYMQTITEENSKNRAKRFHACYNLGRIVQPLGLANKGAL
jgi:hypothetical protein